MGKNHADPLSRDNDKFALLLQLEHHWGRSRLKFQPKVQGEAIGPARRAGLSKAFSKWMVEWTRVPEPRLPGTCSLRQGLAEILQGFGISHSFIYVAVTAFRKTDNY